jgi:hypothetical protein
MQKAENSRDKEKCCERGEEKSTDDRSAERGILFSTLTQSKSHGNHTDNHGKCGH